MIGLSDELLRAVGRIALASSALELQVMELPATLATTQRELGRLRRGLNSSSRIDLEIEIEALAGTIGGELGRALHGLLADFRDVQDQRHLWVHAIAYDTLGPKPKLWNPRSGERTDADPAMANELATRIEALAARAALILRPEVQRFQESGDTSTEVPEYQRRDAPTSRPKN